MKDISTAAVYVSPDGDDSNSGMSAAESVKTFSRALAIAKNNKNNFDVSKTFYVTAGTYTENFLLSNISITVVLQGDVVFNGNIEMWNNTDFFLMGEHTFTLNGKFHCNCSTAKIEQVGWIQTGDLISATLGKIAFTCASFTLTGTVRAENDSKIYFGSLPVTISSLSTTFVTSVILVKNHSSIIFYSDITVTCNNNSHAIEVGLDSYISTANVNVVANNLTGHIIYVYHSSIAILNNNFVVTGTKCGGGIYCFYSSYIYILGTTTIPDINSSNSATIYSNISSLIVLGNNTTFYGPISGNTIGCHHESRISCFKNMTITHKTSSSTFINMYNGSIVVEGTLTMSAPSGAATFFSVNSHAFANIINLTVSGSVSNYTVSVSDGSLFNLSNTGTVSGTITGGSRYRVTNGSVIDVNGAGANRIPGGSAGTVVANTASYYG